MKDSTDTAEIARVKAAIHAAREGGDAGAVARLLGDLRQLRAEQAAEALQRPGQAAVWLDEREQREG